MKFTLAAEQRDFAASIDAAMGTADIPAALRMWAQGDTRPGLAVWSRLADLGVTALSVPEEFGGLGAHPVDLVVACERLGRWCVPGPVTESIAVAPVLLAGDDRVAALASGNLIATVAMPPDVPRAVGADVADLVLVAADGAVCDAEAGAGHSSVDPTRRLFEVTAEGAPRPAAVGLAFDVGVLATAAQLIGAGQAMLDMAVHYARQRSQFGRPIGSYQAIKHKCADLHMRALTVEAAARYAAWTADQALKGEDAPLAYTASVAKVFCQQGFYRSVSDAIQAHGGMGFTWEYELHLYLKRAKGVEAMFGDESFHRERVIEQGGQRS